MSRVPPLDRDDAPPEARPFFDRDLELFGQVLNTTRIAAYRPAVAAAAKRLGLAISEGRLIGEQLRLLLNVRVASLVGCPF
jgi:hypothetical protein